MGIRIAQVKVYPAKGKLDENHALLLEVLAEITPHRPDVVVTPEGFLDGYVSTEESVTREQMGEHAIDPVDSPYTQAASRWAADNNSWLVYGCTRKASGTICNSAVIYNHRGDLVGQYDKLHLQAHDHKYTPGRRLPVFESDFGLFGVMICADRRWPETVRTLALKGARIVFNPTYGFHDDLNLAMMRTRAYESHVFIAFTHPGQALITGPAGEVVANNENDDERFAITEIDPSAVDEARAHAMSHLKDRRPDAYELE